MNKHKPLELFEIKAGVRPPLFKSIIKYRELLFFLSWRDILVRYKQTVIGLLWAILRPFLLMVVFTMLFGKALDLEAKTNIPYPLVVFAALLPWLFFSTSITQISDSFIQNTNLISKVYFPRLIIPLSMMVTCFIDFLISVLILILIMTWYQYVPDYRIFFLPIFILIFMMISLGLGIFIASLNLTYRDFKYIVPFAVQLGFYISPIGYDLVIIPEKYLLIYSLNPMVGIIEGFRWCLLVDHVDLYWPSVCISLFFGIIFLFFGLNIFRSLERKFADKV